MTPKEYKQMMDYLTRSGIRKQIKFASDIARPDPKPIVKEIELFNAFNRRNPKADGGRIGFRYAGPVKFENIIKPKIYEGNRFSKKMPKGTFTMSLYEGEKTPAGNPKETTYVGTKKELKKIFDEKNRARVKGELPTLKDGEVYQIRQGKNKGKFAIRMPKDKEYNFFNTKAKAEKYKTDYLNDPKNKVGGARNIPRDIPKGFVTGEEMLKAAKEKNIFVGKGRDPNNFATVFDFPKTMVKGKNFYDISKLEIPKEVDKILKSQVISGSGTDFAKKKFPIKTKSELQEPRLKAIEAKGGIKKNDPFSAPRGSGAQLGHTGNIFGTELITGDRLAYTPSEVNELMSRKGNLDDKIRTVSAKIENIKKSNKPPKVKKDLLEQADNILIRLASQSQGFKKVTLSDGGTFGGDRLTIDPFDIYKGKTEKEIVQLQKQYLNKPIITEEMAAKNPNLKVTPPEEIAKIQDAYFFEENRKASLKAAQKFPKQELNKIISELKNPDQIRLARIGCPGKATGGRIGYFEGQNLTACAIKGAEKIKNDPINLTGGDQQNLRALGKSAKAVRFLKNFLGPAAIAGELIFEGGFAANKFMSEGVPLKQALGESYINKFVLGPKTQIDVEAERAKEFARGEEFAMAERGRRMMIPQSATADAQRQKERMEQMVSLYPQYSDQQLISMIEDRGFNPQDIVNQKTTTRITPAVTSTLTGLDQLRTTFQEQDALQRIADAGGVANLAGGGIAGLSGGDKSGPPPESGPLSQGLPGLLKRGIKT